MEWVETTGKSLDEAKELALDQLGVDAADAEFEVLDEPRTGLFGRVRGEARVRARVRPATVRPKQERRQRRRSDQPAPSQPTAGQAGERGGADQDTTPTQGVPADRSPRDRGGRSRRGRSGATPTPADPGSNRPAAGSSPPPAGPNGDTMSNDDQHDNDATPPAVDVTEVQRAAEAFATGLVDSFGLAGSTSSVVDGNEIDVRIDASGDGLGLLIGPGGRTLLAIQDLARVAAQRRLGDHETRLRIDVAGYREKRRVALERFARNVADLVKESGIARSLDPMPSADRKVIHDTLASLEGVVSRSEGEDPYRRIIVSPA
jgi:spoIIIJ-associated protein